MNAFSFFEDMSGIKLRGCRLKKSVNGAIPVVICGVFQWFININCRFSFQFVLLVIDVLKHLLMFCINRFARPLDLGHNGVTRL